MRLAGGGKLASQLCSGLSPALLASVMLDCSPELIDACWPPKKAEFAAHWRTERYRLRMQSRIAV
jgi:hypothetical protein